MRTKAAREEGPTAADFTALHSPRSESGGEAGEGRPAFLHPPNFAMSEGTGAGGGGGKESGDRAWARPRSEGRRGGRPGGHHHEVTKGAKRFVASWIDVRKGTQPR